MESSENIMANNNGPCANLAGYKYNVPVMVHHGIAVPPKLPEHQYSRLGGTNRCSPGLERTSAVTKLVVSPWKWLQWMPNHKVSHLGSMILPQKMVTVIQ